MRSHQRPMCGLPARDLSRLCRPTVPLSSRRVATAFQASASGDASSGQGFVLELALMQLSGQMKLLTEKQEERHMVQEQRYEKQEERYRVQEARFQEQQEQLKEQQGQLEALVAQCTELNVTVKELNVTVKGICGGGIISVVLILLVSLINFQLCALLST
ncbi:hypothetical protein TSOC_009272 [Tetrabaena socialis]|uniref:Uncharacterized protein n=1 Tax=Tetrabaena socialis TaxID=47790 RepID=A0A2J7ZW62_9CHLO|nr:hypothetical protein TSOC_009272 [Tetrabaena socialis]|eukprot:PNH04531.1 hypothetical protein TSOC_009272 [Tetrabaena socialis]